MGNIAVAAGWLLVLLVLALVRAIWSKTSTEVELRNVHFPGLVSVPLLVFGVPTVQAAAALLAACIVGDTSAGTAEDWAIAVCGLFCGIVLPVVALWYVSRAVTSSDALGAPGEQHRERDARELLLSIGVSTFVQYWRRVSGQSLAWRGSERLEKWGKLFDIYATPHFANIDYAAAVGIAAASGVSQLCATQHCCVGASAASLACAIAHTAAVLFLRPYLVRFDVVFASLLSANTLLVTVLTVAATASASHGASHLQRAIADLDVSAAAIGFAGIGCCVLDIIVGMTCDRAHPDEDTVLRKDAVSSGADTELLLATTGRRATLPLAEPNKKGNTLRQSSELMAAFATLVDADVSKDAGTPDPATTVDALDVYLGMQLAMSTAAL